MALPYEDRLDTLPFFNVFDALGVEKPTASLSIHELLARISLILDLFQIPNLRPRELRDGLFPAPWQVTAAFAFLASYDIQHGGPGTEIGINQDHLARTLKIYGGDTYRRSFCPERGLKGPGEQRRACIWPFFNFDAPRPGFPPVGLVSNLPQLTQLLDSPTSTQTVTGIARRRNAMVISDNMFESLQDMIRRTNLSSSEGRHQSQPESPGEGNVGNARSSRPAPGIPNPSEHIRFRNHVVVVRPQAPVDSSDSDKDEKALDKITLPRLTLDPALGQEFSSIPAAYAPGYAVMVGSPKAQSHLPTSQQQLVWATFTRRRNVVFTARQENAYGDCLPLEELLRKKNGQFVTAIRLRDINLFTPWAELSRAGLQKNLCVATWAARLCGDNVQPVWQSRPGTGDESQGKHSLARRHVSR